MFLLAGSSGIFELFGMIIIFILVLVACYYTTKFVGKADLSNHAARNIKVLETYKIAPSKYIQVIKVGSKRIVIGVTKDHVEMLTELSDDEYEDVKIETNQDFKFQDVLSVINKRHSGDKSKRTKSKE